MPLSSTSFSFFASRDPIRGHQRSATRAIVAFDRKYFDCVVDAREHNVRPPQVEFSAAVSSTVYRSGGLPKSAICTHSVSE